MPTAEPLRQRRKRELRQQLSDVATRMFLERGFDAVRVADVALACGVTEKTVFNHFRSKEALLVDRWAAQADGLRERLAEPGTAPVDAALDVLEQELDLLAAAELVQVRRFGELIRSTPALVAHNREELDRLTATVAAALAARSGTDADDAETWAVAGAVTGLWTVYAHSLHRRLPTGDGREVARAVRADLHRAADRLRRGV